MLIRHNSQQSHGAIVPLRLRCPGCHDRVTLDGLVGTNGDPSFIGGDPAIRYSAGIRLCPNLACQALMFVMYRAGGNDVDVFAAYPPQRLDFDAADLPDPVREAFEEAITCHSQECYAASAMMVRKTLEEVCRDRGAEGANLKERIAALGDKLILPQPLLAGLDELRLLGNDAAHVESRDYERVAKEEVEVGVAVAKEILKATYQLGSIVDRLTGLKRARQSATPD